MKKTSYIQLRNAQSDLKKVVFDLKRERLKLYELMNFSLDKHTNSELKKFCSICKKKIDWEAVICPHCGNEVIDEYSDEKTEVNLDQIAIIQLNITNNPKTEGIFVKGKNNMSIPENLFKKSQLYSILEMFNAKQYYIITSEGPCCLEIEQDRLEFQGIHGENIILQKSSKKRVLKIKKTCSSKLADEIFNLIFREA